MALFDSLKRAAGGLGRLVLGQKTSDVKLDEDDERRRRIQEQLLEMQRARAFGETPTGATSAARTSADESIGRLRAGLRSRVAAAGTGPAALLAARQAGEQDVAGTTAIERGVTQAAQQSEAANLAQLQSGLQQSRQLADLDEDEKERRRRKGLLPALTAAAGSAFGPLGGAAGGAAGQTALSLLGR